MEHFVRMLATPQNRTGYDFLNNLPLSLQQLIEARVDQIVIQ